MIVLTGEEVGSALGMGEPTRPAPGISTDTRTLRPGDLFIAIRGESYDGHAFVPAAFAAGASAAVVEMGARIAGDPGWRPPGSEGSLYRVVDTTQALGRLAAAVRRKSTAQVFGVTGSAGKTSTKDLLRSMVGAVGPVVATVANENNEIGVPLTLLRVERDTQFTVLEMGMRGQGQIRDLVEIARPDVGVITTIAPVHLELVGSLADVAAAKAELIQGLDARAVAAVPLEPMLDPYVRDARCRIVPFRYGPEAGEALVSGSAIRTTGERTLLQLRWPEGEVEIEVPFSARHRLENTVAATAACYAAGLPLERCLSGLEAVEFTPARGDEIRAGEWVIIDDSYNANPAAVNLALDDLAARRRESGGRAVAILGDMLELGKKSREYHRLVGQHAAELAIDLVWSVGREAEAMVEGYLSQGEHDIDGSAQEMRPTLEAHHRAEVDGLLADLMLSLMPGDIILVKASRGVGLDRLVRALVTRGGKRG